MLFLEQEHWMIKFLPSNELGDFLAGVFSPLAFFILIMGYIQQGKEFRKSEKHRVKEQEYLYKQAQPNFLFESTYVGEKVDSNTNIPHFLIEFQVQNIGNEATEVYFSLRTPDKNYTIIKPSGFPIFSRTNPTVNDKVYLSLWVLYEKIPTERYELELTITYYDARREYQVLVYEMVVMPQTELGSEGSAYLQLKLK